MEERNYSEAGKAIRDVMMPSKAQAWGMGVVGAVVGGVGGWFLFSWLLGYGLYALALPGALIGLGFGFLAKRSMIEGGIFCAIAGVVLMLFCEANFFPFIADNSFGYFFQHLHELKLPTWLFVGVGALMAFWFGRGR